MTNVELAKQWREEHGYVGRGGVIVVFEGRAQGWMNELRDPGHWRPGCTAIDERERTWTAIGGNDQNGARVWLPGEARPRVSRRGMRL